MTLHMDTALAAVMLVGLRVGGLMLFAPFLSSETIAPQMKAGLTVAVTALLYPLYAGVHVEADTTGWIEAALGETVVGLALGLALQFVVEAAQTAGQFLGIQAGYSLVTLLDPQTQADMPVMSAFNQLLALLIFLQLNVHHWLLRGLAASFSYLPPGRAFLNCDLSAGLLRAASGIWLVALEIAAPVIAATLMVDFTLGFLAKASPQLPIMLFGISIKSMLALTVLIGALALWPRVFEHQFAAGIGLAERLLHLAH